MKMRKNSDHEKCHFVTEDIMDVGSLRRQTKDQETERQKETRKGLLRLIHILDTKQGHALHIVRKEI